MCLVVLALDQSKRFPLVIAGNRDEFYDRPATRLAWWSPAPGEAEILSGRDLQAGGTWLGLTLKGRLALLTNVRDPSKTTPDAPTRGEIVPMWLRGDLPFDRFWTRVAVSGYNGFNLIAADFAEGSCYWASNADGLPKRLDKGLYGISNASLDTPWPKVQALKARVAESIEASEHTDDLAEALFTALADRETAPDDKLPSTGIAPEWERALSASFIRTADGSYGTRCSTLVIAEKINKRLVTHVFERSFSPTGGLALLRRATLKNWPPRHTAGSAYGHSESSPVADDSRWGDLDDAKPKRQRAHGLLRAPKAR